MRPRPPCQRPQIRDGIPHPRALGSLTSQERGICHPETQIWRWGCIFAGRSARTARDPLPLPPGHRGGLTLPGHSMETAPSPLRTRIRSSAGASCARPARRRGGARGPSPAVIGYRAWRRAGSHAEPRLRVPRAPVWFQAPPRGSGSAPWR